MAHIYPSELHELNNINVDEFKTLKYLKDNLSNDYQIYHGIHWTRENKKSTAFGEIDFIIVNQSGELVAIEQKNGSLDEKSGELVKHYGMSQKSVYSQIQRNLSGIRDKFQKQTPNQENLNIDYLIFCPDYVVKNISASGIDMSRTVDDKKNEEVTLKSLSERIKTILGSGSTNDANTIFKKDLHQFFLNSFNIILSVNSFKTKQEKIYTSLLNGLADVIDNLEFSPFRLRVTGTAGCGKTQLNMRFVEKMLDQDKKVLLLCFNRPLSDQLQRLFGDKIYVNTYYGFCRDCAEKAGITIDFNNPDKDSFWQDIQAELTAANLDEHQKYDCLIVDEGQDFEDDWHDIIQLFLEDDATQLWLEDPLQNIRGNPPVKLQGFINYRDKSNFRTPKLIAKFIKNTLGVDFVEKNNLPGLGVESYEYTTDLEFKKTLSSRVTELLKAGFGYEDITILTCRGFSSSALKAIDKIGTHTIRKFTGEYDSDNNQVYTEGNILFDSIYRFKGQESPAVILVDLNDKLDTEDMNCRVLYCAMTRATIRLELIVNKDCPWNDIIKNNI